MPHGIRSRKVLYRITFTLTSTLLEATLFNISTSTNERAISVIDAGAGSFTGPGAAGITLYSNDNSGNAMLEAYSATFDNFRAIPAPGAAAVLSLGGLLATRRRR